MATDDDGDMHKKAVLEQKQATEDDDIDKGRDLRRSSFGAATAEFEDARKQQWSSWQHQLAAVLESQFVSVIMGIAISSNGVFVILETNCKGNDEELPFWLYVAGTVLLVLYSVELTARIALYRRFFFHSSWNLFDLFVVGTDILADLIGRLFGNALPSLSVLRVFRVLRLLRFVELLTAFSELSMMVKLMISSVRTMFWGAVLLVLTITFFSIIAVEFLHPLNKELAQAGKYDDCERCARAFQTVYHANLTFFQQLIFGDSWGDTSVVLIEHYPWTGLFLLAAGVTLQVGLLNLILTVMVDKANEQHSQDGIKQLKAKEKVLLRGKEKLLSICAEIDYDQSGDLELCELLQAYQKHREFAMTLGMMDIKYEDMGVVFNILDEDQSGTVTYSEFVDQLYKMKSQDSQTMLIFIKGYVNELRGKVENALGLMRGNLQERIDEISVNVATLVGNQSTKMDQLIDGFARQTSPSPPKFDGFMRQTSAAPPSTVLDALQKDLITCTERLNAVAQKLDARADATYISEMQTSVGGLADHAGGRPPTPSGFLQCSELERAPPRPIGRPKSLSATPNGEPISPISPAPKMLSNGQSNGHCVSNGWPVSPFSPRHRGVFVGA